jgi:lipocalin
MGLWYEQFRYEASFEKDMEEVTARYSVNPDGTVKVVNRGRTKGGSDNWKQSIGKAKWSMWRPVPSSRSLSLVRFMAITGSLTMRPL